MLPIGSINLLTDGDRELEIKMWNINFPADAMNMDTDGDEMVTRVELNSFLKNIILPEQIKDSKKIITMFVQAIFSESYRPIPIRDLTSRLKKGIRGQKPYDENTSFMRNTFGKYTSRAHFQFTNYYF